MIKLVFATRNLNKIREVKDLLQSNFNVSSLDDIACLEELPETGNTIEANSLEKALYVHEKYGVPCFADDSGLEVIALDGAPGVDSAHYSGSRDAADNLKLLLLNMRGKTDRRAQFKTVFTLIVNGRHHQFTGIVTGTIKDSPRGINGFGYDPIFVPDGYQQTFAEMTDTQKGQISHRAKAFLLLKKFLLNSFDS